MQNFAHIVHKSYTVMCKKATRKYCVKSLHIIVQNKLNTIVCRKKIDLHIVVHK